MANDLEPAIVHDIHKLNEHCTLYLRAGVTVLGVVLACVRATGADVIVTTTTGTAVEGGEIGPHTAVQVVAVPTCKM